MHPMAQTNRQTDRQTDGHCDSKTLSAQWDDSVKILYLASSTGRLFSCMSQLRTLPWELLRFTRKYTLSKRICYSIVFQYFSGKVISLRISLGSGYIFCYPPFCPNTDSLSTEHWMICSLCKIYFYWVQVYTLYTVQYCVMWKKIHSTL